MKATDIEATFLTKHLLPEPIVDICRFLEIHGYPISGCFELSTIGARDVAHWFRHDQKAQAELLPFGRGACGDIYAIWLTEGLSAADAPVIMLGSEGQLEVLAVNSTEFCRLLCLGYSEIGLHEPEEEPSDYEATKPFREFILAKYQFDLPSTAAPIFEEARSRFPGFADWVGEHQE
jgi:hypothetical protein